MSTLFGVGRTVEYKYKDKCWRNGTIISSNKLQIEIKMKKTFYKYKIIQLPQSTAMTLFHLKKTLKISNIIFPSWIAYDSVADIYHKRKHKLRNDYKIALYQDGKSITFYALKSLSKTSSNIKIKFINIKHTQILKIDSIKKIIETDKYRIIFNNHSILDVLYSILWTTNIPAKICIILHDFIKPLKNNHEQSNHNHKIEKKTMTNMKMDQNSNKLTIIVNTFCKNMFIPNDVMRIIEYYLIPFFWTAPSDGDIWKFDPKHTSDSLKMKIKNYGTCIPYPGTDNGVAFLYNSTTNESFLYHNICNTDPSHILKIEFEILDPSCNPMSFTIGVCVKSDDRNQSDGYHIHEYDEYEYHCNGCSSVTFQSGYGDSARHENNEIFGQYIEFHEYEYYEYEYIGDFVEIEIEAIKNKWQVKWHCQAFKNNPFVSYIKSMDPLKIYCTSSCAGLQIF